MKPAPDVSRPSDPVNDWIDDDAFERAHAEQKRKRRRALWWLCGGVAAVFGFFAAVVVYSDGPEPDLSDLISAPQLPIPDEENFHVQLRKVAGALGRDGIVPELEPEDLPEGHPERKPPWSASDEYNDFQDFLAAGRGWTAARLAMWDVPLADFAGVCDGLLLLPGSQAPLPEAVDEIYDDGGVSKLIRNLEIAAGMYWRAGDRVRAVEILGTLYRCGSRLKRTAGSWRTTYRRGEWMQRVALLGWRRFSEADAQAAEVVAKIWAEYREVDDAELFRAAIRGEYHSMSLIIAESDAQTLRSGSSAGGMPGPTLFVWLARTRVLFPLVYKPNLTRTIYAEHVREMVKWCDLTALEFRDRGGWESLRLEQRDLFRPANLWGKAILDFNDTTRAAVESRCDLRSQESLLDATLALRRYHAKHGELPDSLAELTPEFLPMVPVDYFDGAPLRYSKAERVVWAVGRHTMGKPEMKSPPTHSDAWYLSFAKLAENSETEMEGVVIGGETDAAAGVAGEAGP